MTILELARLVLQQELSCARLRCELGEKPPEPYVAPKKARAIVASTRANVAKRTGALEVVLHRLAERRIEKVPPTELAEMVATELGLPFDVRGLYRHPYDTMWRYPEDWFGREDIDREPGARGLLKLTKGKLIKRYDKARAEAARLEKECEKQILTTTADW